MSGNVEHFGQMADGRGVQRITIRAGGRAGGLSASVLTLGAVLQDLRLVGVEHGLTLGSDRLADYLGDMRYHGALIGPVANRLTGARAVVAGVPCRFEANQDGGHTLHSGQAGSHLALWDVLEVGASEVLLGLLMPDGAGGFPGNRRLTARFTAFAPGGLRLAIGCVTDVPTIFNATNHSYWNLDGSPGFAGHRLQIAADAYLPVNAACVPSGEIRDVAGSMFDFRKARPVSPQNPPLDNCFCLSRAQVALREVLVLQGLSGVRMAVSTTEPGVQIYDGRAAVRPGRQPYEGIAVETQGWPDAPNQPGFPPIDLTPGRPVTQVTEWRFQA